MGKKKTVDHGNQSNALMKSRNTAVQAWFAAKTASATAGAASTKAASKRVLRNTATKNSVDANTALTGANAAKATAEGLWKKATAAATAAATKNAGLVNDAKTAQAASKATN